MTNQLSRDVFIHQISNPLAPDLGYNLKISMLHENLFSLTDFVKGSHKTKCSLNIMDYVKLGMPDDQAGIEVESTTSGTVSGTGSSNETGSCVAGVSCDSINTGSCGSDEGGGGPIGSVSVDSSACA